MIVKIKAYPGSSQNKILLNKDLMKVYLTCQREKGKANQEMIKVLADYFSVSKSQISLIKGQRSPIKLVKVDKQGKTSYHQDLGQKNESSLRQRPQAFGSEAAQARRGIPNDKDSSPVALAKGDKLANFKENKYLGKIHCWKR